VADETGFLKKGVKSGSPDRSVGYLIGICGRTPP